MCDAAGRRGAHSISGSGAIRQAVTRLALLGLIVAVLCGACAPAAVRPAALPLPTAAPPHEVFTDAPVALPALLLAERNAAAARDLPALAALWAEDGSVHETRATASPADDYHWQGRDAVLNRYAVAVFANPPAPLEAAPVFTPTLSGSEATVVLGVDSWTFVQRDGRWWIQELVIAP